MKLSMWSSFYYDLSVEEALRRIRKAGFKFSELGGGTHFQSIIEEKKFEKFNEFKKEIGIETEQLHAPIVSIYEDKNKPVLERLVDVADFREEIRIREVNCIIKWIDYCKIAGVKCMVVHPGGLKGYNNADEFRKIEKLNIDSFKRIAEKCEKEGVKIAIENMGKPIGKKNGCYQKAEELLELIEKVDSEFIGICIDTSHANMSKVDIPKFITTAGEKIYATHISDNLGENDDHLLPFSGKIDWEKVKDAFSKIGYNGIFNFEIPGEVRCPLEVRNIKINYAFEIGKFLTEPQTIDF